MSASFSRSIRALQNETAVSPIWRILLISILLVVWFGWFFLAEIPVYELSETAVTQSTTHILATFSPDALIQLQPEQAAQLQLDDFPRNQYGTLPAVVTRIDNTIRAGQIQVELRIVPSANSPLPLQRNLSGMVEIEVGTRSPAALVWQSVGQKAATLNTQPDTQQEDGS